MLAALLLLAASASLGSTETVKLFVGDAEAIAAESLGSDATATTYLLGCAATADATDCMFTEPITITQGPTTVRFTSAQGGVTIDNGCLLAGTTSAVCTYSYHGPAYTASNFYSLPTTPVTMSGSEVADNFVDVTLVRGDAAFFHGAPATTSDDGAVTTSGGGAAITSGPSEPAPQTTAPTGSGASGTGSSSTGSVVPSKSTGGMPQMTGGCGWAVGGVAAAVAIAAL
ncbi:hypothetical protein VF21_10423 [Pseudogymnoascus sp. 05NY08]|nr:hypothetical protein VF21_10423 [Pseudogymnoascus sp. 05NY08]